MKKIKMIMTGIVMFVVMMPQVMADRAVHYVGCGDVESIPAPVPQMTSIAYTLLIIGTPLILIAFSIVALSKAVTAGKADEIMKAKSKLMKKLLAGLLVFLVAGFAQFILTRAGDDSERSTIASCIGCFLYNVCSPSDNPLPITPPGWIADTPTYTPNPGNNNSNSNVDRPSNSESYTFVQMAICTDGGTDPHGSSTHNPATAYSIGGEYMDPVKVHYVVAPLGFNGVRNGDFAVVIDHDTGKYVYAIVGERGPRAPRDGYFSEVSLSVAWDLGYTWADGGSGPRGNFETIIFPGTARTWSSVDELVRDLDRYGAQLYPTNTSNDNPNNSTSGTKNIFVGDSRTVGMCGYTSNDLHIGDCKGDLTVSQVGKGYNWLDTVAITQVNNMLSQNANTKFNIIVMLGVNDLGNFASYTNKLQSLADGAWKDHKIIFTSVTPVDDARARASGYSVTQAQVDNFNTQMRSRIVIANKSNLVYCDIATGLDISGQASDGIHYTSTLYNTVYNNTKSKCF